MSEAAINLSNEELDEIKKLSGFGSKAKFLDCPIIKHNGLSGEVTMKEKSKDENVKGMVDTTMEKPFKVVVLRQRRRLSSYEKVGPSKTPVSMWTDETDAWEDATTLYRKSGDGKPEKVAQGNSETLREKYPSLKAERRLYVLHNGKICRFDVKGGNGKTFSTWMKSVKWEPYKFSVVVTSEQAKTDQGMTIYPISFTTSSDPVDLKLVLESMRVLNEQFASQDAASKSTAIEKEIELEKSTDDIEF